MPDGKKLLTEPMSPEWLGYLERNVPLYLRLNDRQKAQLRDDTRILVAEKHWEGCGGLMGEADRQRDREGQGEQEVVRGGGQRIARPAAPERVRAPGDARPEHERRPGRLRRARPRQRQPDEAEQGHGDAEHPEPARAQAAQRRPAHHRHLDRREEEQRTHPGPDADVGEGEGAGVQDQRQGRGHRAAGRAAAPRQEEEQGQRDGARDEANPGERRRIDEPRAERGTAQERVGREAGKRQRGQGREPEDGQDEDLAPDPPQGLYRSGMPGRAGRRLSGHAGFEAEMQHIPANITGRI